MTTTILPGELVATRKFADRAANAGECANLAIQHGDYGRAAAMALTAITLSTEHVTAGPNPFAASLARLAATGTMQIPPAVETAVQLQ